MFFQSKPVSSFHLFIFSSYYKWQFKSSSKIQIALRTESFISGIKKFLEIEKSVCTCKCIVFGCRINFQYLYVVLQEHEKSIERDRERKRGLNNDVNKIPISYTCIAAKLISACLSNELNKSQRFIYDGATSISFLILSFSCCFFVTNSFIRSFNAFKNRYL